MNRLPLYLILIDKNWGGTDVLEEDFYDLQERMNIEGKIQEQTRQGPIYPNLELWRTPHEDLVNINLTRPPIDFGPYPGIRLCVKLPRFNCDELKRTILLQYPGADMDFLRHRAGKELRRDFTYFDLIFYRASNGNCWNDLLKELSSDFDVNHTQI